LRADVSRTTSIRTALVAAAVAATACALWWAALPHAADAQQSQKALQDQIQSGRQREQSLKGAAAQLGKLASAAQQQVSVLQGRVGAVQGQLAGAQALVAQTEAQLDAQRRRARRLRRRLTQVRTRLGAVLRARYKGDRPDIVTVVVDAHGFASLLDTVDRLRRVERRDTSVLGEVRRARADALRARRALTRLAAQRRAEAAAVQTRRDGLLGIQAGLTAREATLSKAQSARLAALSGVQASRRRAERELAALLAAQRTQATSTAGPGGPWAIPWAIVQCESGGQNVPSDGGPSGYYQIMPATWKALGGSTDQAYQAPKAEQDQVAAKLWAGGSGAHNWSCAAMAA
jgi:peptidoglycan hydrolase CwlO-like protein